MYKILVISVSVYIISTVVILEIRKQEKHLETHPINVCLVPASKVNASHSSIAQVSSMRMLPEWPVRANAAHYRAP